MTLVLIVTINSVMLNVASTF